MFVRQHWRLSSVSRLGKAVYSSVFFPVCMKQNKTNKKKHSGPIPICKNSVIASSFGKQHTCQLTYLLAKKTQLNELFLLSKISLFPVWALDLLQICEIFAEEEKGRIVGEGEEGGGLTLSPFSVRFQDLCVESLLTLSRHEYLSCFSLNRSSVGDVSVSGSVSVHVFSVFFSTLCLFVCLYVYVCVCFCLCASFSFFPRRHQQQQQTLLSQE